METVQKILSFAHYIKDGTEMSYNSLIFFVCLLIFLLVYFLMRRQKVKLVWIFVANIVFYWWAGGRAALWIVAATAVVVYLATRKMDSIYSKFDEEKEGLLPKEQTRLFAEYKKKTRKFLILALLIIVAVWVYVKVGKLLDFTTVGTFRDWISWRTIVVPLGISYYSLSVIGYMLDVFWRKTKAERNFFNLFTIMTYFPHIVEGPISKYRTLIDQFRNLPAFDFERVSNGLQLMLWGYIKKLLIADRLVIYTSAVFSDPASYAGVEIFIAVVFCAFQLYADFSGCMDIVRGISQAIGINLDINFRQPFFSRSAAEFWRRWHITLGEWAKDYLFMPISVNPGFMKWTSKIKKKGRKKWSDFIKLFIPLIVVWLFVGLWHGTGWDYIVWGLYWCVLMLIGLECRPLAERIDNKLGINTEKQCYKVWQMVRTFFFFGIGRMFTVAGGLFGCGLLWRQLFAQARFYVLFDGSLFKHGLDQRDFLIAVIGMIVMILVDVCHERGGHIRQSIRKLPLGFRWVIYLAAMFAIVIFGIYGIGYNATAFVYGAF